MKPDLFILSSVIPYTNFLSIITIFIDVIVVWILLYWIIKIVRNNSRTIQIFKGIAFIVLARVIASYIGLTTVIWITDSFLSWGFLAIIVIFQPEIRGILERLGKSNAFSSAFVTHNDKEEIVNELMKAVPELSNTKTGALISIEQSISLEEYIKAGTKINSDISAELLVSIFQTDTPLHDGAVIIKGTTLASASSYFTPTVLATPSRYGARHRAAIGVSEVTDAITIVVSEETGDISIASDGKLEVLSVDELREYLEAKLLKVSVKEKETQVQENSLFEGDDMEIVSENEPTNDDLVNVDVAVEAGKIKSGTTLKENKEKGVK